MIPFLFRTLPLIALLSQLGLAAPQTHATTTQELFLLEKIPLQVDTIKLISRQLFTLSQRPQDKSAIQRRASTQLLILATQLDPTNKQARESNKSIRKGHIKYPSTSDQVVKAKSKLRFHQKWLSNPDAGHDANTLANLLTDATKTLSPETANNEDLANWKGVTPPLQGNSTPKP